MAAKMRTIDWRGRRCRRHLILPCQSRNQHDRREGGHDPVMQGSVGDTREEPFSPCRRIRRLLSDEAELSGVHVSICAGAISPTFAARCGWTRCLHTAVFE